jgi:hypothetical protein
MVVMIMNRHKSYEDDRRPHYGLSTDDGQTSTIFAHGLYFVVDCGMEFQEMCGMYSGSSPLAPDFYGAPPRYP